MTKSGIFHRGEKDPTARHVGSEPFLLAELATMSPNGVIIARDSEGREVRVSRHRVVISYWTRDDETGEDEDFDKSWAFLRRNEMSHRFELAWLLTLEWRPDEGEWLSLLDAIANESK